MSCRACEDRPITEVAGATSADSGSIWGVERISGLRCSRCGALLGADDIVRLLLEKQSQLERFGLLMPPTLAAPSRVRTLRFVRLESD
ncbi:MAG TPA: hypothetical protein VH439_02260 [Gemmatimonadales bacterium]|jgi:hypothetical protein